jgi:hypothetical protein
MERPSRAEDSRSKSSLGNNANRPEAQLDKETITRVTRNRFMLNIAGCILCDAPISAALKDLGMHGINRVRYQK